jgi:hypothetical protein
MAKIVAIQDGIVTDVTPWDGSPFTNPPGRVIVIVNDFHGVNAGWIWAASTNTFYPSVPTNGPARVEKIDFMRLFTMTERATYNALRKSVAAMTPADYAKTDPQSQLMIALDLVFDSFDLVLMVELDHPETIQGMQLLAMGGVFGPDPEHQALRVSQVLSGQLPE